MEYRCDECEKQFNKKSHFDRHFITHTDMRRFKCPECDKFFKRKDHMIRHKNMVHSNEARKFRCPYDNCLSNGFIDNYHLKRHIKAVHDENFVCNICLEKYQNTISEDNTPIPKYRFKKKKQLAKHKFEMHERPSSYTCKFCSKAFSVLKQYNNHMSKHEMRIEKKNKQILDLPESGKVEETKEENKNPSLFEFNVNKDKEQEKSSFIIDYRKRFKSSQSEERELLFEENDLKRRLSKIDSPKLEYKPSENNTLFGDSSIRAYFEKKENELNEGNNFSQHQFLCKEEGCLKSFSTKYNLKTHVKTSHLKIKEFKCKVCEQEYMHKKSLVEHIKREHNDYLYSSDSELALYPFPHYSLYSQKDKSSENGSFGVVRKLSISSFISDFDDMNILFV